ncbi:MOSC domain-containing protein [Shivajiella indica]|uniref:MOSC domain-containing protein n=1 Tax=Shivajiella indica TaxID=872115 RepID=A0ABW5B497_9BACT
MTLQDIYIYPIKSLGGIRLDSGVLEERGFRHDRRWMLVDKEGNFLSQRTFPGMAMLQVNLLEEGLMVFHKSNPENKVQIPIEPLSDQLISVKIWEDEVLGQVVSPLVNLWFSEILKQECVLVKMPQSTQRKIKPKYAVKGESVSFADGMPYLLIGQSSLDDLNKRLEEPVGMDRFRPNLVFAGGNPFEEDHWQKIQIGHAKFKITKPCARCVMTTVNQQTAEKSKEPLKTLATYRTFSNNVMFGQNILLLEGELVRVGDKLNEI